MDEARRLYTEAFKLHWPRTDLDKAQLLAERSLRLFENVQGLEHPDVAKTLMTLAWIHNLKREPEIAETMLQRALTVREKALGPEHLAVADSLSQLGIFWWERGSQTGDGARRVLAPSATPSNVAPRQIDSGQGRRGGRPRSLEVRR